MAKSPPPSGGALARGLTQVNVERASTMSDPVFSGEIMLKVPNVRRFELLDYRGSLGEGKIGELTIRAGSLDHLTEGEHVMALWQTRLDRTKLAWAHERQWSGQGLGIVVEPLDQRLRYVLVVADAVSPADDAAVRLALAQALGGRRIADARPDPPQWAASFARALLLPSYQVHDGLLACAEGRTLARRPSPTSSSTVGSLEAAIACGCGSRFKEAFKPALESPAGRATTTVGSAMAGSLGAVFSGLGEAVVGVLNPKTKTTAVQGVHATSKAVG